jgi:hypothetical protein
VCATSLRTNSGVCVSFIHSDPIMKSLCSLQLHKELNANLNSVSAAAYDTVQTCNSNCNALMAVRLSVSGLSRSSSLPAVVEALMHITGCGCIQNTKGRQTNSSRFFFYISTVKRDRSCFGNVRR